MSTTSTEPGTRVATIRTQVVQLRAEPAKGRQIDGPLALFWEQVAAQAEGQPRQALACSFSVCKTPSCPCRDVAVEVTVVDDRIAGLRTENDGTALLYDPGKADRDPKPWADLTLDLDSGQFRLSAAGKGASHPLHRIFKGEQTPPVADLATSISDLFRRNVDAELLEHLRRRWEVLKGKTEDWKGFDWGWFEPGDMVGWHEAFPDAADGIVSVRDRWLVPLDRYCVDPACKCEHMKVEFVDVPMEGNGGPATARLVGLVEVNLSTGKALKFDSESGMTKLLRAAWKAYSDGADLDKLLPDRQRRMKEVGKELLRCGEELPPTAAAVMVPKKKLGRNDPCACGSGRKYKKCCMGKSR
jgi:hypothetical protein